MCRQAIQCICSNKTNNQQCYQVSLSIQQPFQCICSPCSKQTQIQTHDVVSGLLKYNSNLTKYLAKYQSSGLPEPKGEDKEIDANQYRGTVHHPDKSIVQLYNLKILSPDQYPPPPKPSQEPQHPQSIQQPVQTDPYTPPSAPSSQPQKHKNDPHKKAPKYEPGSNQDKIQKHIQQVSKSSRYLPNTGFKKYFGRQCFQNYGRENTTGVADGIVYNNYLKTFNISPHCGTNNPLGQETYKRALVAGDSDNYGGRYIADTHYNNKQDRENATGYHQKPPIDMPKIIEESQNYEQNQIKYSKPRYQPKVNIISHCPDIINTNKQSKSNRQGYQQNKSNRTSRAQVSAERNQNLGTKIQVTRNRADAARTIDRSQDHILIQDSHTKDRGNYIADISQIGNEFQRRTQITRNNQPIQRERAPNPQYQRWDDNQMTNCDRSRKKQIMQACYRNNNVAHQVQLTMKPKCGICSQRRYTKCCCH